MLALFLCVTGLVAQSYCEQDNTIRWFPQTPDVCAHDGWEYLNNTFTFTTCGESLVVELDANQESAELLLGTQETACGLKDLRVNGAQGIPLSISHTNMLYDIALTTNEPHDIFFAHQAQKAFRGTFADQSTIIVQYNLKYPVPYLLFDAPHLEVQAVTISGDVPSDRCLYLFTTRATTEFAPDSTVSPLCITGEYARIGVCGEEVSDPRMCECSLVYEKFDFPDCEHHSESLDLVVDTVYIVEESVTWKSISFTETLGRLVVNNDDAVMTITTLTVPERLLCKGHIAVVTLALQDNLPVIDCVGLTATTTTRSSSDDVVFIGKVQSVAGLVPTCEQQITSMQFSRYVTPENVGLGCTCVSDQNGLHPSDCLTFPTAETQSPYILNVDQVYQTTDAQTYQSVTCVSPQCDFTVHEPLTADTCVLTQLTLKGTIYCTTVTVPEGTQTLELLRNPDSDNAETVFHATSITAPDTSISLHLSADGPAFGPLTVNDNGILCMNFPNVTLSDFVNNGEMNVDPTVYSVTIKATRSTPRADQPLIIILPSREPLAVHVEDCDAFNGALFSTATRPIELVSGAYDCGRQVIVPVQGAANCTALGFTDKTCTLTGDGVYVDNTGVVDFACPCDASISCTMVIADDLAAESVELSVVPSLVVAEKSIVLLAHNATFDLDARVSEPTPQTHGNKNDTHVSVTLDGAHNVVTLVCTTDVLSLTLDPSQPNDIKTVSGGVSIETDPSGNVVVVPSSSGCSDVSITTEPSCQSCSEGMELVDGRCVAPASSSSVVSSVVSSTVISSSSSSSSPVVSSSESSIMSSHVSSAASSSSSVESSTVESSTVVSSHSSSSSSPRPDPSSAQSSSESSASTSSHPSGGDGDDVGLIIAIVLLVVFVLIIVAFVLVLIGVVVFKKVWGKKDSAYSSIN